MKQDYSDEVLGLRRTVENQNAALAHWRRDADLDSARLRRQDEALFRIAHGHDGLEMVRAIAADALCAETMGTEPTASHEAFRAVQSRANLQDPPMSAKGYS